LTQRAAAVRQRIPRHAFRPFHRSVYNCITYYIIQLYAVNLALRMTRKKKRNEYRKSRRTIVIVSCTVYPLLMYEAGIGISRHRYQITFYRSIFRPTARQNYGNNSSNNEIIRRHSRIRRRYDFIILVPI